MTGAKLVKKKPPGIASARAKPDKSVMPASLISQLLHLDSLACEAVLRIGTSGDLIDAKSIKMIQREYSGCREALHEVLLLASKLLETIPFDETPKPCAGVLSLMYCFPYQSLMSYAPYQSLPEVTEDLRRICDLFKEVSGRVEDCKTLAAKDGLKLCRLLNDARLKMENPALDIRLGRIKEVRT